MIHSGQNMEVFALVGIAIIAIAGLIILIYYYTRRETNWLRLRLKYPGFDTSQLEKGEMKHDQEIRPLNERLRILKDELDSERVKKEDALERLQEKDRELQKLQKLQDSWKSCRAEKEEALQRLQDKKQELQRLESNLESERAEKEDALRRLSAIMASRLKDNNPNVVDLSDQNRPTKIGDQYSELYDNQWTEAYDMLEKTMGEDQSELIIQILRRMLEQCFTICSNHAEKQLDTLRQGIQFMTGKTASTSDVLSKDIMQRLKEERKACANECKPDSEMVWQDVINDCSSRFDSNDLPGLSDVPKLRLYVDECLRLCWFMVIQDPPMAIMSEPGQNPNQHFRSYLTTGTHVKFVVWPTLLLTENGSTVMKGTAEFIKKH